MTSAMLCEFLPWDTEFFGQRIGRVIGNSLDAESMEAVLRWCEQNEIACLYFLADSTDARTIQLAEQHDFHFVDVRVTLERGLSSTPDNGFLSSMSEAVVRPALFTDLEALQLLAKDSYQDSRFYFDPCFPRERCSALYQTWIRRSCEGYADFVWVAELGGKPVGYITCQLSEDRKAGQIGLVGVGEEGRGHGIGTLLVQTALNWFVSVGGETALVVTQGRNIAAQRLYQHCGFVTREVAIWYHKWFIECERESTR